MKNLPVRDADEEIFELRERYEQLHADWKLVRTENDVLHREIDQKQSLIQRHDFEMQQQVETVAYLNNEVRFLSPLPSTLTSCSPLHLFRVFINLFSPNNRGA